jgi:hypothetical protein
LTPTGNIFPLVAQIIKSAKPPSPNVSTSDDSLCVDLPEDPPSVGHVSPMPGKAFHLSEAEREEVGWSSPSQGASDQEYLRNSEQRSKLNHDRPSRKLMLEAAAAAANTSPAPTLGLHQAPAISNDNNSTNNDTANVGQRLLLDAPIPALGAPVARGPRSKASPAEALRKSARTKGASDGPVLERAIRATSDKNNLAKSVIDTATPSSSTPAPGNSPSAFVAFQHSPLDHLLKVAKDSCILFKTSEGSPAQAVALLQARERAQAELLAARSRLEEEEAKAKEEAARDAPAQADAGSGMEDGSKGEPSPAAGLPAPKGSVGDPSGSGKIKKSAVSKRRVARRPTPVGHRPITRQARALSRVSQ